MSDNTETAIKREITRLRNIAKNRPMSLQQKLGVLARVKQNETALRDYRLGKARAEAP